VGNFSDSEDLQVCRDRVLKLSECTVLHSPI
jgi:hypothetical protein